MKSKRDGVVLACDADVIAPEGSDADRVLSDSPNAARLAQRRTPAVPLVGHSQKQYAHDGRVTGMPGCKLTENAYSFFFYSIIIS